MQPYKHYAYEHYEICPVFVAVGDVHVTSASRLWVLINGISQNFICHHLHYCRELVH